MTVDTERVLRETFVTAVEYHPALGSTNDRAKQCAAEGAASLPLLILADEQTAGRGRGANRWWTGRGSLAFSVLLDGRPFRGAPGHGPLVSLAAAVAVANTVSPLTASHSVGIHWPNDVFVAGRKIAGILVEILAGGACVVGIGVNVNNSLREGPAELQSTAVSLVDLAAQPQDLTQVLVALLQQFSSLLGFLPASPAHISHLANAICLQHGRTLTVESGGKLVCGTCCGIAADGALLLDTPLGREKIVSGVLRPS
jgi:BirA family transcriptional regulator, biotin operon repressor / biotin---[acetyl-CoA-carboxylase] ligase